MSNMVEYNSAHVGSLVRYSSIALSIAGFSFELSNIVERNPT